MIEQKCPKCGKYFTYTEKDIKFLKNLEWNHGDIYESYQEFCICPQCRMKIYLLMSINGINLKN